MSGAPTAKKSRNGKVALTPEIEMECVAACSAGFTIEKCAGLIGVPIGTLKTWTNRFPDFARKLETARKKHELSLLRDIELAGQKSWQAKAWIAERVYQHAIPSARLQVSGNVEHSAGQGFAQLIAGLASKRAEKKAQVIEAQEIKAIEQHKSKYNTYCTTNATQNIATPIPLENEKPFGKARHVRMKRRKPRQKAIDTTTPPAQPPAAI